MSTLTVVLLVAFVTVMLLLAAVPFVWRRVSAERSDRDPGPGPGPVEERASEPDAGAASSVPLADAAASAPTGPDAAATLASPSVLDADTLDEAAGTVAAPTAVEAESADVAESASADAESGESAKAESVGPASGEPEPAEAEPEPAEPEPAEPAQPEAAEPEPAEPAPVEAVAAAPVAPSFASRLAKARTVLVSRIAPLRRSRIDEDAWDDLEEALLGADVGVRVTSALLADLRRSAGEQRLATGDDLLDALAALMKQHLNVRPPSERSLSLRPAPGRDGNVAVWLFVGVNGVGKTTTIGKVADRLKRSGSSPLMAAGDTFRAAAAEQLEAWAQRTGADAVTGSPGADPSSVVHDGIAAAAARGADVVLADTAGRLQNKSNLMAELAKVRRVADRDPGSVTETLLVIDATTGQNGLSQALAFAETTDVTGIVLTKLDGSAKGGIVFAVEAELGIPVKLVGLGESAADLVDFDPDAFVDALLARD